MRTLIIVATFFIFGSLITTNAQSTFDKPDTMIISLDNSSSSHSTEIISTTEIDTSVSTALPTVTSSTSDTTVTTATPHKTTETSHETTTETSHETTTESSTTTETPPNDVFYVKDKDGNVCILVKFDASFSITYKNKDDKSKSIPLNIPKNATVMDQSSCGADIQTIVLSFDNSNFTMSFNKTNDKVGVNDLKLQYILPDDAKSPGPTSAEKSGLDLFSVDTNSSYLCNAPVDQVINDDVTLHLKNFRAEAFMSTKDYKFSSAHECSDDDLNDVIPIAVGCALAGLVIIVLIAYLVGRRRSHQKGYQSV